MQDSPTNTTVRAALGSRRAGLFRKEWGLAVSATILNDDQLLSEGGVIAGHLRSALEQGHTLVSLTFAIICPPECHAGVKSLVRALLERFGKHPGLQQTDVKLQLESSEGLPSQSFTWQRALGGFDSGTVTDSGLTPNEAAAELSELRQALAGEEALQREREKIGLLLDAAEQKLTALLTKQEELESRLTTLENPGTSAPSQEAAHAAKARLEAEFSDNERKITGIAEEINRLAARVEELC